MDDPNPSPEARWLRRCRGAESQERLAADISAVTGWRITRDRYSKYESGSLPIGRVVLSHFVAYWEGRGVALDLTQPTLPPDPIIEAMDRQTAVLQDLVAELLRWRTEDRTRLLAVERSTQRLLSSLQPVSGAAESQGQPAPRKTVE